METLQKTITDAILLTRELGINYLWVDALCIVQDSEEDWQQESTKMASIYANAIITIASVSSKSAAIPFLRQENSVEASRHQQRVFSHALQTGSGPVFIKARLIEQSGIHWRWQSDSDERSPKEPWAQRGWTLQEQILSSRLLMISSTEMQWVCKQAETCECLSTLNRRRQFGRTPLAQLIDAGETFQFWHKLVETYSNRSLSQGKDKLPAISGIAEAAQQKTNSRYVAGLWEDNIDLDLLWYKTSDLDSDQGYDSQAPSFSWASVDGEVDYYCFRNGRIPYRKSATMLSIETYPSPQTPLGRVAGGKLTIRGPLIPSRITKYSEGGWAVLNIAGHKLEFIPDTRLGCIIERSSEATERIACRRGVGQAEVSPLVKAGGNIDDAYDLSPGIGCWVLQLGLFKPQPHENGEWDAQLMVLGLSVSRQGCYERLGMASDTSRSLNALFGNDRICTFSLV